MPERSTKGQIRNHHFSGSINRHVLEIKSTRATFSQERQTAMPTSKKVDSKAQTKPQGMKITIGLPPESPYSDRAELAAEAFHDRLEAGEYPELFDPKEDYLQGIRIFGKSRSEGP